MGTKGISKSTKFPTKFLRVRSRKKFVPYLIPEDYKAAHKMRKIEINSQIFIIKDWFSFLFHVMHKLINKIN